MLTAQVSAHRIILPLSLLYALFLRFSRLRGNRKPLLELEFAELHAPIHLAHMYQCPDVEVHAPFVLKKYYTSHFTEYNTYDASATTTVVPPRSSAVAAINIARLTETPSRLPFTFYHIGHLGGAMMDRSKRRDGSTEHLDVDNLRRYIVRRPCSRGTSGP